MKSTQVLLFWVCLICFACTPVIADTFYVEKATGSGVSEDEAKVLTELVRSSVSETKTHKVVGVHYDAKYTLHPKILKHQQSCRHL